MPREASGGYAKAINAAKRLKESSHDTHGNIDELRAIWPLPDDDAQLIADLVDFKVDVDKLIVH